VVKDAQDLKFDFLNMNFKSTGNFRDNYKIGAIISSSPLGEVRKCQNKKTGAIRAVKIWRQDAMTQVQKSKFLNEFDVLKQFVRDPLVVLGPPQHPENL